eukprot:scaffold5704_cov96-Cylindrotheca_fusiformis.AAC.1
MAIRVPYTPVCSAEIDLKRAEHQPAGVGEEKPTEAIQRGGGARKKQRNAPVPECCTSTLGAANLA